MIFNAFKRILYGVAAGSLITFTVLSFLIIQDIHSTIQEIWKHWLASMLIGIYYSFASIIFESERWSLLKQTVIHLTLTILIFFPISFVVGWIPFNPLSIVIGLGIFLAFYFITWTSMYFYYKSMERSMNELIDREQK